MKISKIIKIFLCAAAVVLLFSGCDSNKENLKDLSVVEGIGIDYSNDIVSVTVQSLNLAKEGSGAEALSGNITMNTRGEGRNISAAVENVSERLSKKPFFGQNRIIVFGMDFAKENLNSSLDYLLRSVNSRPDVIVCISQEKAENVLASKEYDALVPAQAVSNLLETGEKSGIAAYVSSNDLLNLYTDKTSDIYLPVVAPGDESVSVSGIAVFSGDKIVDILSDEDSFGLMFMKGKVKNGLLDLSSEKFGKIGAEIIKTKVKTKAVFENGKIVYKVKIKAELVLDEIENGIINSISEKDIFEINSLVSRKITENCKSAFYKCTENKSDCLRIGESLAAENYKAYQSVSDNWHEYLSNAELDISVNAVLKQVNENSRGGQ